MSKQENPELAGLVQRVQGSLDAFREAASEIYNRRSSNDEPLPVHVTVQSRVTLTEPDEETMRIRPYCYAHHYVGGHFMDGTPYYVVETVCIEVQGMAET